MSSPAPAERTAVEGERAEGVVGPPPSKGAVGPPPSKPAHAGAVTPKRIALPALSFERLARLRAEWELAREREAGAKQRLQSFAERAARELGVHTDFQVDFETGHIIYHGD